MLFARPMLPDALEVAGRRLPLLATRHAAARGVRLRADARRGVIQLTLPPRGGVREALALIDGHRDWLARQVARWPRPVPLAPGASLPFDGGTLTIRWDAKLARQPRREGDLLHLGGPPALLPGRVTRWLKDEALADLAPATERLAALLGRPLAGVRVGDPIGRWGSCASRDGAARIAYSWRLILAPAWVRHHVVAHEAAHLVHPDHSPRFHALLAELDPHATASRRWLARHGPALHWVGREE